MTIPTLQPGDRLLTLRRTWFSRLLGWWLSSAYSHCVPILTGAGVTLGIVWPRVKYGTVTGYLQGHHDVVLLRPRVPLTAEQRHAWLDAGSRLFDKKYDIRSYLGFVTGRGEQNPGRVNCAEALLTMDQAAGLLTGRDMALISPQSYAEFASAGLFDIIWRSA